MSSNVANRLTILDAEAELDTTETGQFDPTLGQQIIRMILAHDEIKVDKWQTEVAELLPSLRHELFSSPIQQLIVAWIHRLYSKHGTVPTHQTLWRHMAKQLTTDDPYQDVLDCLGWDSIRRQVTAGPNPRDTPYVIEEVRGWVKQKTLQRLLSTEVVQAIQQGNLEPVQQILQDVAMIGTSKKRPYGIQTVGEFMQRPKQREWLVEDVLVANQPMLIAGSKKTLKTAIVCDLFLSLATGTKFLKTFQVQQPRQVLFFSCESGEDDIESRLLAIAGSKGIDLARLQATAHLSFERPRLSNSTHLSRLDALIQQHKIEVVIVDPLYLTLLTGGDTEVSAANLFQMGDVFSRIADVCNSNRCTPVFCHHFKKNSDASLDLDQMTFVGAAEFARQSILLARTAEYESPRNNQLRMRTHGHNRGGLYRLMIDEGTQEEPKWHVTLEPESEAERRELQVKTEARNLDLAQHVLEDIKAIEESGRPATKNQLRSAGRAQWHKSTSDLEMALEKAEESGWIEGYETTRGHRAWRSR
jgi:RecA-family ATPase